MVVQAYAQQSDLFAIGLPAQAMGNVGNPSVVPSASIDASLTAMAALMDSYFRGRWGMIAVPLVTWDASVTSCNARLAAYDIMVVRGFSSDSDTNKDLRKRSDDALAWLDKVQRQQAHPLVTLANGQAGIQQPNMVSSSVVNVVSGATGPNRGW